MCDRLPPQRIDARTMASLGQMAAHAQALADDLADEDGADALLPDAGHLTDPHALAPARIRDWSRMRPEERYAHGRHPPAWPDLAPPRQTAAAPAWACRLAAWLREAVAGEVRPLGH